MIDWNKPIEYRLNRCEWKEAVLLDKDYNGDILIKYREDDNYWALTVVSDGVFYKIRNVPEVKQYMTVTLLKENIVKKFWMCWVPGRAGPTHKHETRKLAEKEGARLIDQGNAPSVVILEAIAVLEPQTPPVLKTELAE